MKNISFLLVQIYFPTYYVPEKIMCLLIHLIQVIHTVSSFAVNFQELIPYLYNYPCLEKSR